MGRVALVLQSCGSVVKESVMKIDPATQDAKGALTWRGSLGTNGAEIS